MRTTCMNSGVQHKRNAIVAETEKIIAHTQAVDDIHMLEHAVATLSKLSATLLSHVSSESTAANQPNSFVEVETFAPAQRNEPQLQFKKTTGSAGRKQKIFPLK